MRAFLLAACLVGSAGCAFFRVTPRGPGNVVVVPLPTDTVTAETDSAAVEVRYSRFSPTISVLGWSVNDAGVGIRSTVRRDGSLVRDHRLYVSTYYVPAIRSYHLAAIPPLGLEMVGVSRDYYACYSGRCSPFEAIGVRIPDEVLRSRREGLAVMLYGRSGREMSITVRRELIDAYLARLDSVRTTLRKRS
jgi:hypothetical protein